MTPLEKIELVKKVLGGGKKIAAVAKEHGVSTTTVRRYMDQYTEGEIKFNIIDELEHLRMHVHLARTDNKDILQDRIAAMERNLSIMVSEYRSAGVVADL